jgi:gluconate 5-dehydrogenase
MVELPLNDSFSLREKVVLVTGGGRGIGLSFAEAAGRAGAHVVDKAVRALREKGISCSESCFDITSEAATEEAIAEILSHRGRIDVLVNNAGNQNRKPFLDYTLAEWQSVLDVHVTGTFLVSRAVARHMVRRRSGSIIMIGSIMATSGRGTIAPYRTAKAGVTALAQQLAIELGPHNVRCNVIAPGYVETELTRGLVNDPKTYSAIAERIPLGRWAQPDDIAPALVFLSSDAGKYVNGHVLHVDGGTLASL